MTNQNRPVYRHPPRSHAYSCRCPRCEPFRNRSLGSSGAWIWPLLAVLGGISWAAGAAAHHLLQTAVTGAGIVVLALVTWVVVILNRRASRPPKGRLRVEAVPPVKAASPGPLPRGRRWSYPDPPGSVPPMSSLPPTAAESRIMAPYCYHQNAVPVDLSTGERVAWWCEQCETQLPAEFGRLMRACCTSKPGWDHAYNCPRAVKRP